MKRVLLGAVLCTALNSYAMSPDETSNDLSSVGAHSTPASPSPISSPEEFKSQFKAWIDKSDVAAFQSFLKEHFSDAESYITDDIVEYAKIKKKQFKENHYTTYQAAKRIHSLLKSLEFGNRSAHGDMEKIWHIPSINRSLTEESEIERLALDNPRSPIMPSAEFLAMLNEVARFDCAEYIDAKTQQKPQESTPSEIDILDKILPNAVNLSDFTTGQKITLFNAILSAHVQNRNLEKVTESTASS